MGLSLVGAWLGQYELLELIGQGGMADVYRARQANLDRDVAIKVLPTYFAREEGFLERFKQEAKSIARFDHPNILAILDYGEQDGTTYLVMPLVMQGTLRDKMRKEGRLSLSLAGKYLSQMASALQQAHDLGIVHRDIKPANMLLGNGDRLLLSDFGIAKAVEGNQHLTKTGAGVGTPEYMAPEQATAKSVDARADIYSLGVVLFAMLTAQLPYTADTPIGVSLKHVTAPLPKASEINPEIPIAVEAVIQKAMAKKPEDRYQRAEDFATAFQEALLASGTFGASQGSRAITLPEAGTVSRPALTDAFLTLAIAPAPPSDSVSLPVLVASPSPIQSGKSLNDSALPTAHTTPPLWVWLLFGVFVAALVGGGIPLITTLRAPAPQVSPTPRIDLGVPARFSVNIPEDNSIVTGRPGGEGLIVEFSTTTRGVVLGPPGSQPLDNHHGHYHIFIDDAIRYKIVSEATFSLILTKGIHRVRIELHHDDHSAFDPPVMQAIHFQVDAS